MMGSTLDQKCNKCWGNIFKNLKIREKKSFGCFSVKHVQFCRYSLNSRCHPSSGIFAVQAEQFGYFFFMKRVKCSAKLYCSKQRPFFWHLCCTIDVIFRIQQTSSKFGQRQLVMKNQPRDLNQYKTKNNGPGENRSHRSVSMQQQLPICESEVYC